MDRLLDVNQVSELLGVKSKTVYAWVNEGYIPYYKVGRLVRFNLNKVLKWLKNKEHSGRKTRVPQAHCLLDERPGLS